METHPECPDCGRTTHRIMPKSGLCTRCYKREWRRKRPMITCSGCRRRARSFVQDLCQTCYARRWNPATFEFDITYLTEGRPGPYLFGDPLLPERFWSKVRLADSGCWIWTGHVDKASGYGRFRVDPGWHGKSAAHLVAFRALAGPVGDSLVLDHTCHTNDPTCYDGPLCLHRRCVNVNTLEAVTQAENNSRRHALPPQRGPRVQTCKWGHPWHGENLYTSPQGRRKCRTCERDGARRRYHGS